MSCSDSPARSSPSIWTAYHDNKPSEDRQDTVVIGSTPAFACLSMPANIHAYSIQLSMEKNGVTVCIRFFPSAASSKPMTNVAVGSWQVTTSSTVPTVRDLWIFNDTDLMMRTHVQRTFSIGIFGRTAGCSSCAALAGRGVVHGLFRTTDIGSAWSSADMAMAMPHWLLSISGLSPSPGDGVSIQSQLSFSISCNVFLR
jgi:hypothetical protein